MKAVVFHDVGTISLDNVADPEMEQPNDAIVRLTASAICGTDLHMIRGTMGGMEPGTILGHEGVGVIEEVGTGVRNLRQGDRVLIPSTVSCGYCSYCRSGYTAHATWPTRTVQALAPRFLAGRNRPALFRDFRPSTPGHPSPTRALSSCQTVSTTSARS